MIVRAGILIIAIGLICSPTIRSADQIAESVMYSQPEIKLPEVVTIYPEGLLPLWIEALGRPEDDFKTQAALAIAKAHNSGMKGLDASIKPLEQELKKKPSVTTQIAIANALVTLNAKSSAETLFELVPGSTASYRDVVEPALARWDFQPAREYWLKKIASMPPNRETIIAIRALLQVKEQKAIPRVRELMLLQEVPLPIQIEAAKAAGSLKQTGYEQDATSLLSQNGNLANRLVAANLLRHHSSEEAKKILTTLAMDAEPAVAAIALSRLLEIDAQFITSKADDLFKKGDSKVRKLTVDALAKAHSKSLLPKLVDRLNDAHPDVRLATRTYLVELTKIADYKQIIIAGSLGVLNGKDWRGQEQATLLLATLDHKAAASRIVELLESDRGEVAIATGLALRKLSIPETLPQVMKYIKKIGNKLLNKSSGLPAAPDAVPAVNDHDLDIQLSHLVQFFGILKYTESDSFLRSMIPPVKLPPNPTIPWGPETRAAAAWSLGKLHAGKEDADLVRLFAGRLAAVVPGDLEDNRVRRMSGIAIGMMKAQSGINSVVQFGTNSKPSLSIVNNACDWAAQEITGTPRAKLGVVERIDRNWFLTPIK